MITDKQVWVIGGGGHAKVAIATLTAAGWSIPAIFDDACHTWGTPVLDVLVVGGVPEAGWWRDSSHSAFLAVGSNRAREGLAHRIEPADWPAAIHPTATVHPSAKVGSGTLVCAHAVVQPDSRIGAHAIINTGAVVEHDVEIGDFVHVGPRGCLAGAVVVGEGAFVGAGATVIPGIRIGSWSTVGAGGVVVRDVTSGDIVVGVPARVRKYK